MARAGLFAHYWSHMMGGVFKSLDVKGIACALYDNAARDCCGIIRLACVWGRGYVSLIVAFGDNEVCNKILFSIIKPLYGKLFYTNYISSCSEIYGDSDGSKRYLIQYDIWKCRLI